MGRPTIEEGVQCPCLGIPGWECTDSPACYPRAWHVLGRPTVEVEVQFPQPGGCGREDIASTGWHPWKRGHSNFIITPKAQTWSGEDIRGRGGTVYLAWQPWLRWYSIPCLARQNLSWGVQPLRKGHYFPSQASLDLEALDEVRIFPGWVGC